MVEQHFCKVKVGGSNPSVGSSSVILEFMSICLYCGKKPKRNAYKYCSNKCQFLYQHEEYIKKWRLVSANGNRGILTKNISSHVRRYLIEKYREECSICGWKEKNPITGKVPLDIDHVNGNSEDSSEKNLRLVCPNCHSLSSNFKNLNKGKGRHWRMAKYIKNAGLAE